MDKSIKQYQSKFQYKFDMDSKAIDLREMSRNFPSVGQRNGFIPLDDISEAINLVFGAHKIGNSILWLLGYGTAQVRHGGKQNSWGILDK